MKLKIKYDKDGSIYSEDDKFKNELNDVLNLNLPWLKENRKSALIGYQRAFNQKYERHVNDRATLEREISKLCSVNKEGKNVLIFRMRNVPVMDISGLEALEEALETCNKRDMTLLLSHVNEQPMKVMEKAGFITKIGQENICDNIDKALERAEKLAK